MGEAEPFQCSSLFFCLSFVITAGVALRRVVRTNLCRLFARRDGPICGRLAVRVIGLVLRRAHGVAVRPFFVELRLIVRVTCAGSNEAARQFIGAKGARAPLLREFYFYVVVLRGVEIGGDTSVSFVFQRVVHGRVRVSGSGAGKGTGLEDYRACAL